MRNNKRKRKPLRKLSGEIHEDDGIDPRTYFRSTHRRSKDHYKNRQLCQQVAQTLSFVLGEFADERLHSLCVVSVDPAPDASQLLVTVSSDLLESGVMVADILSRLQRVEGRLRTEIAAAISRKRTPRLRFQVMHPPETREEHK